MRYYAIDGDARMHTLGTFTGELACDDAYYKAEEELGSHFTVIDQNEMAEWVTMYLSDMRI